MKTRILLSLMVLPFACGGGNLEMDSEIGTTSEQSPPPKPAPPDVQRNDKSNTPVCESDGTGCFSLAPGAVIMYWKGPESTPID